MKLFDKKYPDVLLFLLIFLFPFLIYSQTSLSFTIEEKIHLVENSLKKEIQIQGEDNVVMNIIDRMRHYNIHSMSIAIISNNKIEWTKAYNISENEVNPDTLFQAASISKSIAAVMALSLVENNKLFLDNNVNEVLTTWKVKENFYTKNEKVTLRRLLSHTAGLNVRSFEGYCSSLAKQSIPDVLQILNGENPASNLLIEAYDIPGNNFSYSGGGYMMVQKMMEDVTQKRFSKLASEIVFEPLKMTSSTFEFIWPHDSYYNIALGYSKDDSMTGNWKIYPESAAAGLWTTPSDLARFVIEIQDAFQGKSNSILSKHSIRELLTQQPHSKMGLGFKVNPLNSNNIEFSSSGLNHGYCAYLVGFTKTGQGVVMMINSTDGGKLMFELIRSIADVYNWPEGHNYQCRTIKPIVIDVACYQKYVGQFELIRNHSSDPLVIATLSIENNKLFINLSFENDKFELIPESETKFFALEGEFEIEFNTNNNEISVMGMKANRI